MALLVAPPSVRTRMWSRAQPDWTKAATVSSASPTAPVFGRVAPWKWSMPMTSAYRSPLSGGAACAIPAPAVARSAIRATRPSSRRMPVSFPLSNRVHTLPQWGGARPGPHRGWRRLQKRFSQRLGHVEAAVGSHVLQPHHHHDAGVAPPSGEDPALSPRRLVAHAVDGRAVAARGPAAEAVGDVGHAVAVMVARDDHDHLAGAAVGEHEGPVDAGKGG